jgi:enoyl-CoA hydratase/carnithine racemase
MSDAMQIPMEWNEWKEWETLRLQTHQVYPEIGILRLNRPAKLNAINNAMMTDLHSCLDLLCHAFDCRVVILCGEGRLFCSGADLSYMVSGEKRYDWENFPEKVKQFWQGQHEMSSLIAKLRRIPQPVIAAVFGAAVGAGMGLVNASDIVVASRGAKFINAFIKIGASGADCGSSYFLPRILGFHRSAELLYSGRDLTAEEAFTWGYVNVLVVKDEEATPQAVQFAADHMLTKSPLGLRLTKEALNFNIDAGDVDAAIKFEDRNQVLCGQSEDMMEAITAFFEKRRPKYGSR